MSDGADNLLSLNRSRPEDVKRAQEALDRRRLVASGNRYQPKIVWTLVPWKHEEIRAAIEAEGAAPFVVYEIIALDRRVLTWAGAPGWAQYAYLAMVEVKALGLGPDGR